MPLTSDEDLKTLLTETGTIALVGASNKPHRASNDAMKFLPGRGFRVIPIDPGLAGEMIHDEIMLSDFSDIEGSIDMVDIFRNSEAAGAVVDQAISVGVWQSGCNWV